MIKRLLSLIILLTTSSNIIFADVQHGYVRTIKRAGKKAVYLENVVISVKGINGNFKSKKNGKFELELRPLNLKENDTFFLSSVYKSGYELYDNNLERHYTPDSPIEIILRDFRQEAADQRKFADNTRNNELKQKNKKIEALERQLKQGKITEEQKSKELQKFNAFFEKYEVHINTIAKHYAGLDYENIDPITEAIGEAFSNGDFELADSLLNTLGSIDKKIDANLKARSDIDAKIDFGTAILKEGNNERRQNLQDAERLAELAYAKHLNCLNDFQNDSAAYYLKKRIELLPENVTYQVDFGSFLRDYMAQYQEASEYFNKALILALEQNGDNHPDVATIYDYIGTVYYYQSDYNSAVEYFERALKIRLEVLGENHHTVAASYNNIGMVYDGLGYYNRALEYFEKALKVRLEILGENHSDVAQSYNNIGFAYSHQKDYNHGLEYFEKALKIRLEILEEKHPDVAESYNNIGAAYDGMTEYFKALENYEKALKLFLGAFGENHPKVASIYNNIGAAYEGMTEYFKALENYEKALKILLEILGENHPDVALSYDNIGCNCGRQEDYENALEYFEKALKIRLEALGGNHPDVAKSYNNIGMVYIDLEDSPRALKYFEKARIIWLEYSNDGQYNVAQSYNNIGWVYDNQGDYARALDNYEKALEIQLGIFGENHPDVATSYSNIGWAYHNQGDYDLALENFDKGLKIWMEYLGENLADLFDLYLIMYETHLKLLESDKSHLNEFENFMSDKVWVMTITGENSPAAKRGLNGEYVIYEYGEWDIDCQRNIIDVNKSLGGKPKDIVLYRDGEIIQHHFENQIGMQLSLKLVGIEKKKQIEGAYKKWVAN